MLSNKQKALLKTAQRDAGIEDADYREMMHHWTGCSSSTDPRLTDEGFDLLMGLFEGIYWWQKTTAMGVAFHHSKVFKVDGYWGKKNPKGNTSRDRYAEQGLEADIAALEVELEGMGYGGAYLDQIKLRAGTLMVNYRAALKRTIAAKRRALEPAEGRPF